MQDAINFSGIYNSVKGRKAFLTIYFSIILGNSIMNEGIKVENLIEMRLDKWLWAARFFKTRCLAQKAIEF